MQSCPGSTSSSICSKGSALQCIFIDKTLLCYKMVIKVKSRLKLFSKIKYYKHKQYSYLQTIVKHASHIPLSAMKLCSVFTCTCTCNTDSTFISQDFKKSHLHLHVFCK